LEDSSCVTINRDKGWFVDNLPKLEQMWNFVLFFRNNKDKLDLFMEYINSLQTKRNKDIMYVAEKLANTNASDYKEYIKSLKINVDNNKIKKVVSDGEKRSFYGGNKNRGFGGNKNGGGNTDGGMGDYMFQ